MKISVLTTLLLIAGATDAAAADATDAASTNHFLKPLQYHVQQLPTLGGVSSIGNSINNLGLVAGRSNLPDNSSRHAVIWRNGELTDLRTLGGPNSNVVWPVKNILGIVSGITQTDEVDTSGEAWSCSAFFPEATATGYRCVGFVWRDDVMTELPTLGGTHGFATGTNNWGFTVGWAENKVRDRTCVAPQILQFRAVVWGPDAKVFRQLRPLKGHTTSAATAINDLGEVVGISGICDDAVGKFSAISAVRWDLNGVPHDLGNIGGNAWNTSMAINLRGDIAGFANVSKPADGAFDAHAFLWTRRGGMRDLGTLKDHVFSQAYGINIHGQVVGRSCDVDFNCRAFLWQNGAMIELKKLMPGYAGTPTIAADIDDLGRITGQAIDAATGQFVAFVATPVWW
jgi:probable HAF family extracellular repeat protein